MYVYGWIKMMESCQMENQSNTLFCYVLYCHAMILAVAAVPKDGGSGQQHDQRHGHTAGKHHRHLGGMASGMASTAIYDSEVWSGMGAKYRRWSINFQTLDICYSWWASKKKKKKILL